MLNIADTKEKKKNKKKKKVIGLWTIWTQEHELSDLHSCINQTLDYGLPPRAGKSSSMQ